MNYLATSKNDFKVYYDKQNSHAATHLEDTPQLLELVREIIPLLELTNDYVTLEYNFGRPVGLTDLITNQPGDEIVYAKRKNRDAFNPFNKSQKPQPCSYVTIALQRESKVYELLSAFIGREGTPPFPLETTAKSESRSFWNSHSFAFGIQEIQVGTLTTRCPW